MYDGVAGLAVGDAAATAINAKVTDAIAAVSIHNVFPRRIHSPFHSRANNERAFLRRRDRAVPFGLLAPSVLSQEIGSMGIRRFGPIRGPIPVVELPTTHHATIQQGRREYSSSFSYDRAAKSLSSSAGTVGRTIAQ